VRSTRVVPKLLTCAYSATIARGSSVGGGERAVQPEREPEVAEVVGGELQLPAPRGALFGRGHHARVVDQDVQRALPAPRERGDRSGVGQLQFADPQRAAALHAAAKEV
jgi:hypothetical protein